MTEQTPEERCWECTSFRWLPPVPPRGYCDWCISEVDPKDKCGCQPSNFMKSASPCRRPFIPVPLLTNEEFAHIAFRLNICRCNVCKQISEKLCDARNPTFMQDAETVLDTAISRIESKMLGAEETGNYAAATCYSESLDALIDVFGEKLAIVRKRKELKVNNG